MEQSTKIDVEVPGDQAWEVLCEVELWPEWTPAVTSVRRLEDGPLAVGPSPGGAAPEPLVHLGGLGASARPLGTCSRTSALAARV